MLTVHLIICYYCLDLTEKAREKEKKSKWDSVNKGREPDILFTIFMDQFVSVCFALNLSPRPHPSWNIL